jgi:hypothetical protein
VKSFIAIAFLSLSLTGHTVENYQDDIYNYQAVSGQVYQNGEELRDNLDQRLQRRFGEVTRIEISEEITTRQDLQGQLQALRRGMRTNEEIIVRVKRDPQQVIDVRLEDNESLITYASSFFGMAVNTVGRIMYLGMPQSTSEVIAEAQEKIDRLNNNEVHDLYVFSDYHLKAAIDSRHREAFIINGRLQSLEQESARMSGSHYYYGGVANALKSPQEVDTKIIDLFLITN